MTARIRLSMLLGLCCLCVFSVACREEEGRRTRPVSFEVREGTDLGFDLSPDGRTIVIDLLGQLWAIPVEGGRARPLTNAAEERAEDRDPAISPNGMVVAAASDRPSGRGIYLLDSWASEGLSEGRLITQGPDARPAWSPDGRQLAFVRGDELHLVEASGAAPKPVRLEGLPSQQARDPTWAPDGSRIVFANANQWTWGRLWSVVVDGGPVEPITAEETRARRPCFSPDGESLAYFAMTAEDEVQLWLLDLSGGEPRLLVDTKELNPRDVRWLPGGNELLYSAQGRFWRLSLEDGRSREVPFVAGVRFSRRQPPTERAGLPEPGDTLSGTGHRGTALSPGGDRIAMIALGNLWIVPVNGEPRTLHRVPKTAEGISWSPDQRRVVWSAGPYGGADLFVTEVETASVRRLTDLRGHANRPAWSPDGRYIAFVHWETPALDTPAWQVEDDVRRLRVIPADQGVIASVDARALVDLPISWGDHPGFGHGQEIPQWSPQGDAFLVYSSTTWGGFGATLVSLSGETRRTEEIPTGATFVTWLPTGDLLFLREQRLWKVAFDEETLEFGEAEILSSDPALYPSVAQNGSVLYTSLDGLRILGSEGQTTRLGWPLLYEVKGQTGLLLRGLRVLPLAPGHEPEAVDILMSAGRIDRIEPSGRLPEMAGFSTIDAGGRFAMPGLIDLHVHLWDPAILDGSLYHGVTTIRDLGSPIARSASWRDEVEAGLHAGSRILFGAFNTWDPEPGKEEGFSGEYFIAPTSDDSPLLALRLLGAFRGDHLKHRGSASQHAYVAQLIGAGNDLGLTSSAHVASIPLIAAGLAGKEHLGVAGDRSDGRFYEDIVELFRSADLWVVPTHVAGWQAVLFAEDPEQTEAPDIGPFLSPFLRYWALVYARPGRAGFWRQFVEDARHGTERLHLAGVRIGAGSDAPHLPWALHRELEWLVEAGLSPAEAIAAATTTAAKILRLENEIGEIAVGKRADLVILDGNPLEDIRNTRTIWAVVRDGEMIDREKSRRSLERQREQLASATWH